MDDGLLLVVQTPHEEVLRARCHAVRVPTHTGQVGLLPRAERGVLAVEPGIIVAAERDARTLVGTAGGLLHVEARQLTLLSALAVVGVDVATVRSALDALLGAASTEMELRRRIEGLERGLLIESGGRVRQEP